MNLFDEFKAKMDAMSEEEKAQFWHEFNFDPEHHKRISRRISVFLKKR
jgi:hypothetical protein